MADEFHWSRKLPEIAGSILAMANEIEHLQIKLDRNERRLLRRVLRNGYSIQDIHRAMLYEYPDITLEEVIEMVAEAKTIRRKNHAPTSPQH